MKRHGLRIFGFVTAGLIVMVLAQSTQSQDVLTRIPLPTSSTPLGQKATVNWTDGLILVEGAGTAPKGLTEAQARLRSLGAARADAQRLLAAAISGIQVDAETTVRNYELQDDTVRTKVVGFIRGAVPVDGSERVERQNDGSFIIRVTYSMPLYGDKGLATIVYPELAERNAQKQPQPQPSPQPQPQPQPQPSPQPTPTPTKSYTGLIVDARGLKYSPCMAPKILQEDGREVWGTFTTTTEFANDVGIAAFVKRLEDATTLKDRGAPDQLLIKAVKTAGPAQCNAVIKNSDAATIRAANEGKSFLQEFKVTFLF